jgi:hypothetical protein
MIISFISLFLMSAPIAQASPVFAIGAVSGGGGKGVVCRTAEGAVRSVELLDLWEARTIYGKSLDQVSGDLAADVETALQRLKNSYPFRGGGGIEDGKFEGQEYVLALMRITARDFLAPSPKVLRLRGVTLTLTDDSYELARPTACGIEQIVNYQVNGKTLVNEDLYDHMDALNRASLVAHEAFYATLNDFAQESNSIRVRRAVGFVFAGGEFAVNHPVLPADTLVCESAERPHSQNIFFLRPTYSGSSEFATLAVQPYLLAGSPLLGVSQAWNQFGSSPAVIQDILGGRCTQGTWSIGFGFGLDGPVEFDRDFRVTWQCRDNKFSMHLTHRPMGGSLETVEMTCRQRPNPNTAL